jgi:hypothetical protein
MIDRTIIPQLEDLRATLGRMCDGLEAYNKTLTYDVIETDAEDEASSWLFGTQEAIEGAWRHLGAAIRALKQEDQP